MPWSSQLPPALDRVIAFSRVGRAADWTRAELEQTGEMWRAPDTSAMSFTARQWIDVCTVGFSWRARFPLLPLVALHVEDALEHDEGRLTGRLWGWMRLFVEKGPEANRAQAIRYLAELVWAPAAYLGNASLRWEETADGLLRVSCELAGTRVHVDFEVDSEGRIVSARAPDRPRGVGGTFLETPWIGRFDDWQEAGGLMVPMRGEVAWELPEGTFTYWRGRITQHAVRR